MSIEKYMDASTCYITQEDDYKIKAWNFPRFVIPYDEGYFIHVPKEYYEDSFTVLEQFGMSPEFINLLKYAVKEGCWFLRLDCDGDNSYDFPKFDW